MMDYTLTPREVMLAGVAGLQRNIRHLYEHTPSVYGAEIRDPSGWSYNNQGTIGEWTVAKALRIWWPGGVVCENGASDLPHDVEVRTGMKDHYRLLVYPSNRDDRRFVLAVGVWPHVRIAGWLYGHEAKRTEWWDVSLDEPAYAVPQDALRDLSELARLVWEEELAGLVTT